MLSNRHPWQLSPPLPPPDKRGERQKLGEYCVKPVLPPPYSGTLPWFSVWNKENLTSINNGICPLAPVIPTDGGRLQTVLSICPSVEDASKPFPSLALSLNLPIHAADPLHFYSYSPPASLLHPLQQVLIYFPNFHHFTLVSGYSNLKFFQV